MPTITAETERFTQKPHQQQPQSPGGGRRRGVPEEEEADEALSLCDLPLLKDHQQHNQRGEEKEPAVSKTSNSGDQDFDFGSLSASLEELEAEMCSADEVFYRGKILPFRHSVSAGSLSSSHQQMMMTRCPSQPIFRSGSGSGLQSCSSYTSSSRSSSTNSSGSYSNTLMMTGVQGNYSATDNTMTHTTTHPARHGAQITSDDDRRSKSSRFNSHSHMCPSPKPQIRAGSATAAAARASFSSSSTSLPSSSAKKSCPLWEVFRLGLVRAPEIDLEGWKNRQAVKFNNKNNGIEKGTAAAATTNTATSSASVYSRNSSSNSCGSGSSCDIDDSGQTMRNYYNHFMIGPGKRSSTLSSTKGSGCYKYDRLGSDVKQSRRRKRRSSVSDGGGGGGLFNFVNYGNCRCSIGAIEPERVENAATNAAVYNYSSRNRRRGHGVEQQGDDEKGKTSTSMMKKSPSKKQGEVVVSRHRTFEWLRDISTVGVLNTS